MSAQVRIKKKKKEKQHTFGSLGLAGRNEFTARPRTGSGRNSPSATDTAWSGAQALPVSHTHSDRRAHVSGLTRGARRCKSRTQAKGSKTFGVTGCGRPKGLASKLSWVGKVNRRFRRGRGRTMRSEGMGSHVVPVV